MDSDNAEPGAGSNLSNLAPSSSEGPHAFKAYFDFLADVDDDGFVGETPIIRRMSDDDVIIERTKHPKILNQRYLVGEALGDGAYAKVKACRDLECEEDLAVKIIAMRPLRKMRDSRRQVEQECAIMRYVHHENVVCLRDDFYDNKKDKRYFFMDLCLGSVHDLQARGLPISAPVFRRLPETQARHYFAQLMCGLEHLHACRVVHKDVKPGNLLLTERDLLKITDFGVSEQLPEDCKDDTITSDQGTPAILPPEVAGGHVTSFSGFKVDVYGAGICLFFMLLGRVPFRDANVMRILQLIDEGRMDLPEEEMGPEPRALILAMLARDPELRLSVAEVRTDSWLGPDQPCRPQEASERAALGWLEPRAFLGSDLGPLEEALQRLKIHEGEKAEKERRRGLNSLGIFEEEDEPPPSEQLHFPPRSASAPSPALAPAPSPAPEQPLKRARSRSGSSRSKRGTFLSACCIS